MTSTESLELAARLERYYQAVTEKGFDHLHPAAQRDVVRVLDGLETGEFRVAELREGVWAVNVWVKQAILLYFRLQQMQTSAAGPLRFVDKIPVKEHLPPDSRIVPGGTSLRFGSYLAPGTIVMPPSYVNIGAYIDAGTMIDSHVLVGSGAQIGQRVHLAAGVQIGGILEPPQAAPVIIEDDVFIGMSCGICEGAFIGQGSIVAAGTMITGHVPIIDVNTGENLFATVPPRSLVIPGGRHKETPAGTVTYQCPLLLRRGDYTNADLAQEMSLWTKPATAKD
jgi:2,3,4,5-tetrahydropyridine-2,6-dicarboxylate N-succinyltransferase